jgi:hypothetical protein
MNGYRSDLSHVALLGLAATGSPRPPGRRRGDEVHGRAHRRGPGAPGRDRGMGMADVTVDTEAMTISWMVPYEEPLG